MAWVYDLVRGYAVTRDQRYGRAFDSAFELWRASSPPFRGPHWSCGQETAIRAVALLYGEANLPINSRMAVQQVLGWSGERIADALGYAESQRNNHFISEAAGLIAIGVRLLDAHPDAQVWLRIGHRALERAIRAQFEQDGWYVQHSFNYLRVALDQCVVAERSLRKEGLQLSHGAVQRLAEAVRLVIAVMDADGSMPNYGANDGAFVHPVTLTGYTDFRSTVTAACALWQLPMPADIKADEETLAWLGVASPPGEAAREDGLEVGVSGWAAVRMGSLGVFLRAGRYESRPGHIDPLHLTIRYGGRRIVIDAGTYSYAKPPPWNNGLASAEVHNGPVVMGRPPALRGPRFLWLTWPRATIEEMHWSGDVAFLRASAAHGVERSVEISKARVRIVDRRRMEGGGPMSVRWLFASHDARSLTETDPPAVCPTVRDAEPFGWSSTFYNERTAAAPLEVTTVPESDSIETLIDLTQWGHTR